MNLTINVILSGSYFLVVLHFFSGFKVKIGCNLFVCLGVMVANFKLKGGPVRQYLNNNSAKSKRNTLKERIFPANQ